MQKGSVAWYPVRGLEAQENQEKENACGEKGVKKLDRHLGETAH